MKEFNNRRNFIKNVAVAGIELGITRPPVTPEETTEIYALMAAAEESTRNKGIAVSLESILKKARQLIND